MAKLTDYMASGGAKPGLDKGAPVGAAFQPLRPADGPEVFLLHGFAKIRIQQQFVSAQAGCKAVIRLAGLHCFHKSTF